MYKGYGLAVAIDILSGILTGAAFSNGVKSLIQQWEEPQHIGHFFIVIDPVRFMPWQVFSDRMKALFNLLRNSRQIDNETSILVPGELETQKERNRRASGIPFDVNVLNTLKNITQGDYEYELPKF